MVKSTFLKNGSQDFFQTQDLRWSNPLLKKLEKAFCLQLFSIQGTAQDRCVGLLRTVLLIGQDL